MIGLLAILAAQAHSYELVVRFPGNSVGYNRIYRNAPACHRAREVILADYRERIAEQTQRYSDNFVPGPPPIAICVPT